MATQDVIRYWQAARDRLETELRNEHERGVQDHRLSAKLNAYIGVDGLVSELLAEVELCD